MSSGLDEASAGSQAAAVCELQVWRDPFLSWFVSSVMVIFVVPEVRSFVGSPGLSEINFMYCADAGAAKIESKAAKMKKRDLRFMEPLGGWRLVACPGGRLRTPPQVYQRGSGSEAKKRQASWISRGSGPGAGRIGGPNPPAPGGRRGWRAPRSGASPYGK